MGKGFSCLNRSHSAHAAAPALRAEQSSGPAPSSLHPQRVGWLPAVSSPPWGSQEHFGAAPNPSRGAVRSRAPQMLPHLQGTGCALARKPQGPAPKVPWHHYCKVPSETSAERCQTDISRFPGLVGWLVCLFSLEAAHRDVHPEPGPGLFMRGAAWPGRGPLPWAWRAQRKASLRFALPAASIGHAIRLPSHLGAKPRSGTTSIRRKRFENKF